jgi:aminopeptidase N
LNRPVRADLRASFVHLNRDDFARLKRFARSRSRLRTAGFAGVAALCLLPALAHAQPRPRSGPATLHAPRVREYHVRHLKLFFNVNAADHSAKGIVTHYLTPLRTPLSVINMDARANLKIDQCRVDGKEAQFQHQQDVLTIIPPSGMAMGKVYAVEIRYTMPQTPTRGGANGAGGFRWIDPDPDRPDRRPGFWTQGETNTNSSWVPCYDFPNDKCTSETHTTVPAEWTVIGNGIEGPVTEDKTANTRTYHWTMKQPHSTYLLSLAGGEMDVQKDEWRGVPLYYAVPKGKGNLIPGSYGNTPDMLSWFSDNLGVKYAWPKYAQTAVFDFPGGMENVSATTMGVFLVDKRAGNYPNSSLNSHELAHQWFGDLVTCKDWGDIWLNESFATFFEMFYMEHLDGAEAYEREVENNTQGYLRSARGFKRALSTNTYSDPDSMFEPGHTYAKGGVILHMLRRELGDKLFFKGLGAYLEKFRYQPVDTADLEGALSAYTKRDLKPFFDQWVRKPGHPVLDMTWTYDDTTKEVVATVKQMQNQGDGTPLYTTPLTLGLLPDPGTDTAAGQKKDITQRHKVTLSQTSQEFRIPSPTRPAVVLIDPDQDMLKEVRDNHWTTEQLPIILRYAPNSVDRRRAAGVLGGSGALDAAKTALFVEALQTESGDNLAAYLLERLGSAQSESLRALFREQSQAKQAVRRAAALSALSKLPATDEDTKLLRAAALSDTEEYRVVVAAMQALGKQDAKANLDVFQHQGVQASAFDQLASASVGVLEEAKLEAGIPLLLSVATGTAHQPFIRGNAVRAIGTLAPGNAAVHEALVGLLNDAPSRVQEAAVKTLLARQDKDAIPALKTLASTSKNKSVQDAANDAIGEMEKKVGGE